MSEDLQPSASSSTSTPASPSTPAEPPRKKARTGKARKEAKLLAIARQEAEARGEVVQSQVGDAIMETQGIGAAEPVSAPSVAATGETDGSKKRKRDAEDEDVQDGETSPNDFQHDGLSADVEKGEGPEEIAKEAEAVPEKQTQADMDVVKTRIPQALKSLLPILKKSKTVESQRLIKKIKFLRSKAGIRGGETNKAEGAGQEDGIGMGKEVKELEEQFEVLKKLDLHTIIPPLLLSKLVKHPLMRPHLPLTSSSPGLSPLFPPSSSDPLPSSSSTPTIQAKLENKLYSSKGVGPQIKAVIGWCVGEEGVRLTGPSVLGGGGSERKAVEEKPIVKPAKESMNEERRALLAARGDRSDSESGSDGEGDVDGDEVADGWESGSVDDADGAGPPMDRKARLAELGSSDDDGGDDIIINSDYDDEEADEGDQQKSKTSTTAIRPTPAIKPSAKTSTLPPLKQPKPGAAITSSLFLPSLSTGFIRGENADEDYGLDVDEKRENKKGGERKNRRGQAERRAIWEKKYGKGANHVKKAQAEEATQAKVSEFEKRQGGKVETSRWGASAGPTTGGAAGPGGKGRAMHGKGSVADRMAGKKAEGFKPTATSTSTSTPSSSDKPKTQNEPPKALHPSWEAARLKKMKEGPAMLVPQGKKIVF